MSFDSNTVTDLRNEMQVSIPFEQGDVFRQEIDMNIKKAEQSQSLSSRAMSFDSKSVGSAGVYPSLNPFRAGRCLSTY